MSITLKEVITNAGYNLDDNLDDMLAVKSMLSEAEELSEEIDDKLDAIREEEDREDELRYEALLADMDARETASLYESESDDE